MVAGDAHRAPENLTYVNWSRVPDQHQVHAGGTVKCEEPLPLPCGEVVSAQHHQVRDPFCGYPRRGSPPRWRRAAKSVRGQPRR
ncbi:hypothetical protein [Rhodococcus koreensis]|uniref:hypothetical protein n=1 Tax=Rhodococcus koreensis TaxID=99653 RepID=UPI00115FA9CD|nr:hypothetical protein [Rhodococcus koreensis]